MTAESAFGWIEGAQALVAAIGFTVAMLEWRTVRRLRAAWETEGEHILAKQAVFIEWLRASVHVVIFATAALSLTLPEPPVYMPHWITQALVLRKVGFLWVAVIACAGTVSARRARLAFAKATRGEERTWP